jgi:hypothetical protein
LNRGFPKKADNGGIIADKEQRNEMIKAIRKILRLIKGLEISWWVKESRISRI